MRCRRFPNWKNAYKAVTAFHRSRRDGLLLLMDSTSTSSPQSLCSSVMQSLRLLFHPSPWHNAYRSNDMLGIFLKRMFAVTTPQAGSEVYVASGNFENKGQVTHQDSSMQHWNFIVSGKFHKSNQSQNGFFFFNIMLQLVTILKQDIICRDDIIIRIYSAASVSAGWCAHVHIVTTNPDIIDRFRFYELPFEHWCCIGR